MILVHVDEVEAGNRSRAHVRLPRGAVDGLGSAVFEVAKEGLEGFFDLIEDEMVDSLHLFMKRGRVRPSGDDGNLRAVAALNDLLERRACREQMICPLFGARNVSAF
ncbi:MAG: hypothetical protein OXI71_07640, partial [Gemmatimonadota bacterium]|nr:hypothetical protein [Gemmatimonadota bacterium]